MQGSDPAPATREALLAGLRAASDGDPFPVLVSDLAKLQADDIPVGAYIQPLEKIDKKGVHHLALNGTLTRGEDTAVLAHIEQEGWRKYWDDPLGVEKYHDLVREAVEARERTQGDVELLDVLDMDVVVAVHFAIRVPETNLRNALDHARLIQSEILEAAESVSVGIEDLFTKAFKRLQGWGTESLDTLVDRMRQGTSHEKGVALEELTTRLFQMVPGFSATGHIVTRFGTEEIDINIQNASEDPVWQRESDMLIAECKNWSKKCGKNEFVTFKDKLRKRTGRVSSGFLVSWNGFANTVKTEMLSGAEGDLLVVLITGAELRGAVRNGDFPARLKRLRQNAVFLKMPDEPSAVSVT